MGKGAEHLGPDDSKVLDTTTVIAKGGEAPVEDVAEEMAQETGNDGLATEITFVKELELSCLDNIKKKVDSKTYKRSDTQLKKNEVGSWRKRPTEAMALLLSLPKSKDVTMDGA